MVSSIVRMFQKVSNKDVNRKGRSRNLTRIRPKNKKRNNEPFPTDTIFVDSRAYALQASALPKQEGLCIRKAKESCSVEGDTCVVSTGDPQLASPPFARTPAPPLLLLYNTTLVYCCRFWLQNHATLCGFFKEPNKNGFGLARKSHDGSLPRLP